MTRFDPRRYVAIETAISVVMNTIITALPNLLTAGGLDPLASRPVRDVAVSLTPQFFMCAFMSALVPSMLTRWRRGRGLLGAVRGSVPPSLVKLAATASVLAVVFTVFVLALIHLTLPGLAGDNIGGRAALLLSCLHGASAGAIMTPAALILHFGKDWSWQPHRFL